MIAVLGTLALLIGVAFVAALVEREFDIVAARRKARHAAPPRTVTLHFGPYL